MPELIMLTTEILWARFVMINWGWGINSVSVFIHCISSLTEVCFVVCVSEDV